MNLALILAFVAVNLARSDDDFSRYENFDVEEVINNKQLLKVYIECFREIVKCTPEGFDTKRWNPNSVQESCSKCSEKQKSIVAKVILATQTVFPEEWAMLNKLHKPKGKYEASLNEFLQNYGL